MNIHLEAGPGMSTLNRWADPPLLASVAALSLLLWRPATADDAADPQAEQPEAVGCAAYDVDVSRELGLLAGPAASDMAPDRGEPVPVVAVGDSYLVELRPERDVALLTASQRKTSEPGAYAASLALNVPKDGTWRVSVSRHAWIDVVDAAGTALQASRHQGRQGCAEMRKFVEFPLQAGVSYTLQLTTASDPAMKLLVTGPIAP